MCLFVKEKEPLNSDIEAYKIVEIHKDWNFNKNKKISPIVSVFRRFPIFAGENVAQGNLKLKTGGIYEEGCIHCFYDEIFLNLDLDVLHKLKHKNTYYGIIKCLGKKEDFVAWGCSGDIAFSRIFVSDSEIKRVLS